MGAAGREALMGGRAVVQLAVVALVTATAACGGSADKAGGRAEAAARPVGKPVTLTLATVDDLWAREFAAAARRLSGGTVRIDVRVGGEAIVDYERRLVARVRAGDADMASVGARAWDRMGVTSFQGLVAPVAIDTLGLQRRVLASPTATRSLEAVQSLGLVGLALLPGTLRRPFGLARRLGGPEDYAGATIGTRLGRVAKESLEALGATPRGYRIGSLAGLDGAALDVTTIVSNGYDARGSQLTANVVLWARPETIVISRDSFERLPPAQRDVLRRAGREAVGPVAARIAREQRESLDVVCDRGALSLVTALPAELRALRAAVQPVVERLERNGATRRLLAEIRRLRAQEPPAAPLRCAGRAEGASALDGVWESTVTEAEMLANGATPQEAETYGGRGTLELADGRWTFRTDRATVTGTYAVGGDGISFTMLTCTANPCEPGATTDYGWSVYRERLSFERRAGQHFWAALVAEPRVHVR